MSLEHSSKEGVPGTNQIPAPVALSRWRGREYWRWAIARCSSHLDLAITILLLSALAVSTFAIRQGPAVLTHFDFLDFSWMLDLAFKSHHGVWLGGDVFFTYGPFFQWMLGSAAWVHGWSIGAFFKYGGWLIRSCVIIATWLVATLLLAGQPAWKRAFYIFVLVVFWMYWDVRLLSDVLLFAACLWACDRTSKNSNCLPLSLALALVLSLAFLISADTGVYGLAAFVIVTLCQLFCLRYEAGPRRLLLRFASCVGAGVVVWSLLLGCIINRAVSLAFWKTNLAILAGYRWAMSSPMQDAAKNRLFWITGLTLAAFALGWIWSNPRSQSLAQRPVYLLSAMCFSLFTLQSSFVRSDWGHVSFGLFPGIMLAAAVLMGAEPDSAAKFWQTLPVFAAFGATAAFSPAPSPMFVPRVLALHLQAYRMAPVATCPPGMSYLDDLCLAEPDYQLLHAVASYLDSHTVPSDRVAVFPYENVYGVAAHRQVAGAILENYQAVGSYLLSRQLASLDAEKPPLAVYSADGVASNAINFVPNLTRSPELWLYLQEHYEKAFQAAPGVVVLRRNPSRPQFWKIDATDLPVRAEARMASFRRSPVVDVADGISWPARADFLKLTLRLRYPMWWRFLKPSHLFVELRFADGTAKNVVAIVPPNRDFVLWIYPWRDGDLESYFSADENAWRSGVPRVPVERVRISPYRLDRFAINPTALEVERLQAVQLSLANQPALPH